MMIINGTIYVKKEIGYILKPELIEDENGIRKATKEELELIRFFNPEAFKKERTIDLDENFWIIFSTSDKIYMHNHNQSTFEVYNNIDEVKSHFIPLESFLSQSSYLGKKLILPAGSEFTKNGKTVFCTKDKAEYIILFILADALIIKGLDEAGEYRLISRFNPEFSQYIIGNEINPEYSDKKQVYQDIIAQIYQKGKKDNQERKHK